MKRILAVAILALSVVVPKAATIYGTNITVNSGLTEKKIVFKPIGPTVQPPYIVSSRSASTTLSSAGSFSINLLQGEYEVFVDNVWRFNILVPDSSSSYNIADIAAKVVILGTAGQFGQLRFSTNDLAGFILDKFEAGTNMVFTLSTNGSGSAKAKINSTASGGAWGGITGTLSSQTDLQSALDAKASITQLNTASNAVQTAAANADNLTSGTVADSRIASTIARDSEVTTAVSNHEAAGDPHPTYTTAAEAAVAAPVQSVNGLTGEVTITPSNWQNSGTTNATLAGTASTHSVVATNGITAGASTFTGLGVFDAGLRLGADVSLIRDTANTLALRNDTNPQAFRFYQSYTDASNFQRGILTNTATSVVLGAETAGTGADNVDVTLTPAGTGKVIVSAGLLFPNGGDIGASGANRPENVYVAGAVFAANGTISQIILDAARVYVANKSVIDFTGADGVMLLRNYAGTDFNRLQFGGTTASFPSLKRNSTALETKLADDSAFAPHKAAQFVIANTENQVVFGATNTAPASSAAPTKWISVQVQGESAVYRLPLYE